MNLSNCPEIDNLTLNCYVGAKLSIAGYFRFAHLLNTIITIHCGIVLDFTMPKSAIRCRIRQCYLIEQSVRTGG